MPFKSEEQRKFMWANRPDIARRWSNKYGSKPVSKGIKRAASKRLKGK